MECYIMFLLELFFLTGTGICFFSGTECRTAFQKMHRAGAYRKKLPSMQLPRFLKKEIALQRQHRMEDELAQALAYVRNMVILGRGKNMSGELLMEELSDVTKLLRPAFLSMAASLHLNDTDTAAGILENWIHTPSSREIGGFLARWEQIETAELKGSVDAFCSALRESRETRLRRRDERISDLVYFPVVADCMFVLLNFIYVAYFIEQRQAMEALFS